jgi:hypothetical protein
VFIPGIIGIVSLAVDFGRVQVAKAQLQSAVDVAAHHAARGLSDSTADAKGIDAANDNHSDGSAVTLLGDDIDPGNWNSTTRVFTEGGAPSNAVRVSASKVVPLAFGQLFGKPSCQITASAVALVTSGSGGYGAVGLDWVQMKSNTRTDSYDSTTGAYSSSFSPDDGTIASNGSITLDGGVTVRGDARPGPGKTATGGTVTGVRSPLGSALSYANVDASPFASSNNNTSIPSGYRSGGNFELDNATLTVTAGNYYFSNFTMKNDAVLNVSGTATIYLTGTLFIDGNARTGAHSPSSLKFRVAGSGNVSLIGNNGVYADIYAPQSAVFIDSNKHLYGVVIGKTLTLDSNAQLHVDEGSVSSGTLKVALVD